MNRGLPPFGSVQPMLAVEGEVFDSPDFFFEPKWDGFRALGFCPDPSSVRFQSRHGRDLTPHFPELVSLASVLPGSILPALLDGEIVALKEGRPDFHALARRMPGYPAGGRERATGRVAAVEIVYAVFDLLFCHGDDLRSLPLARRRQILEESLSPPAARNPGGNRDPELQPASHPALPFVLSPGVPEEGSLLYRVSVAQGFEGVVAKRLESRYRAGRSRDWIKIRVRPELDAVVGGFLAGPAPVADRSPSTTGTGATNRLHSLLLGLYGREGRLQFVGRVGTGWTPPEAEALLALLRRLEQPSSPFAPAPQLSGSPVSLLHWVEPRLVVVIAYREWTPLGLLRQPSWKGIRHDKSPEECVFPVDSVPPAPPPVPARATSPQEGERTDAHRLS
ncbi:MAG TPA: DNA ligase [Firmicutes bacterium]|nr:DNA ligase [Bacillota bacterium]